MTATGPVHPLPWRNRIVTKTVVLMLTISLVPLLLVGSATVYFVGSDAEQKAEDKLLATVAGIAGHIDDYITGMSEDMEFIVMHVDRKDLRSRDNRRVLAEFTSSHPDIHTIWVVDDEGRNTVLFSRSEMLESERTDAPPYYRTPGQAGAGVVWHATEQDAFGEHFAVASIPIRYPWETRSEGFMFFKVQLESLQKAIGLLGAEGAEYAYVVNDSGQLIAHTDRSQVLAGADMSSHPEVKLMLKGDPNDPGPHIYIHEEPKGFIASYEKLAPLNWGVAVEKSKTDVYRMRDQLIWLTVGGFMAVIVLVMPLAVLFSYRLTNPIGHLMKTATELAAGHPDARAEVRTNDEIGVFAKTFNLMVDTQQKTASALAEEKERLLVTLRSIGDAVITTDTEGKIVLLNKVAEELTGWESGHAVGRPLEEVFNIINEYTRERCVNPVEKVLESGMIVGLANHTALIARDGSEKSIADSGAPILDRDGNVLGVVLVFRDITEEKLAEEQILASLKEKEVLLSEVHHRVKNNMAVISSLLALQSEYVYDKKYLDMFNESQSRIRSMSLVHEKLYMSDDFAHVDVRDYVSSLAHNVRSTFMGKKNVSININAEAMGLDIDNLIPCGLIINEILTNAFKYAFNDTEDPEIGISMVKVDNDNVSLTIKDNGIGLPEGFDISRSKGLGLKLVHILAKQLDGKLEVMGNNGTTFRLTFPEKLEHTRYLPDNGENSVSGG